MEDDRRDAVASIYAAVADASGVVHLGGHDLVGTAEIAQLMYADSSPEVLSDR